MASFNGHPGTQVWLDLAPYSSSPSYQAVIANRTLSRQLAMMPCEEVLQTLQEGYAEVQKSSAMMYGRQATDSHAEALLSYVQHAIRAGQAWFKEHQTTTSLLDILVGRTQPFSLSPAIVSARDEVCRDIVQGRCVICCVGNVSHASWQLGVLCLQMWRPWWDCVR